jgi:spermidine/putrescine transport system permease protein
MTQQSIAPPGADAQILRRPRMSPPPRPRRFRPNGLRALRLFLGGWTAAVFVFLYLPIAVLVVFSFNLSRLNVVWTGFTLDWYRQVAGNGPLLRSAQNSLVIAIISTVLSIGLGTGAGWLLYRYRFRGARLLQTLTAVPMVMPEILMGISLLVFFAAVALPLGFTTVIIGHVTFCFPFVLVAVQARLRGLDPALEEAALDLGATPMRAFWLVIVPWLRPAIIAGGLMAFTLSWDELIVTFFTTSAASATLPIRVFGMAKVGLNPMLNALSAVIVFATAALVLFTAYVRKLGR